MRNHWILADHPRLHGVVVHAFVAVWLLLVVVVLIGLFAHFVYQRTKIALRSAPMLPNWRIHFLSTFNDSFKDILFWSLAHYQIV